MGSIVGFRCLCGYEKQGLFMGFGFSFPTTMGNQIPAYCSKCEEVVLANYFDKSNWNKILEPPSDQSFGKCPNCNYSVQFYNENTLFKKPERSSYHNKIQWGNFRMPEKDLLCPKCKRFTMECIHEGCWD